MEAQGLDIKAPVFVPGAESHEVLEGISPGCRRNRNSRKSRKARKANQKTNRAFNKYLAAIAAHDDATAVRIWNTVLSYLSEDDVASAAIAANANATIEDDVASHDSYY
jgi:hypothetical protein